MALLRVYAVPRLGEKRRQRQAAVDGQGPQRRDVGDLSKLAGSVVRGRAVRRRHAELPEIPRERRRARIREVVLGAPARVARRGAGLEMGDHVAQEPGHDGPVAPRLALVPVRGRGARKGHPRNPQGDD